MPRYVLDANIISAFLAKEPTASNQIINALADNSEFLLCPVVYYQVYRGLLYKDARNKLDFFLEFTDTFTWEELNRADWEQAARLWANLRRQGQPLNDDADLLIGVYALRRNAVIVTDNTRHFERLGASLENWRR